MNFVTEGIYMRFFSYFICPLMPYKQNTLIIEAHVKIGKKRKKKKKAKLEKKKGEEKEK